MIVQVNKILDWQHDEVELERVQLLVAGMLNINVEYKDVDIDY